MQNLRSTGVSVGVWFRAGLFLAILLLSNAALLAKGPEVGKAAPAYQATLLDGSRLSDADQRGDVVIVNFWATWCVPCRAEMPALEAYYQEHRTQGLKLLAISMDDPKDEAKVRQVMATFSFPAAMARDANFKGYGRIWRIPLTFVIDRDGILRKDGWYGDAGIDLPMLEKTVTPLLVR
jgi:thiol-disulfide isomerase/thioredoxin